MAEEHFGIRLDTDKLEREAEKARQQFESIGREAEVQGKAIDTTFSKIAKGIAMIGVGFTANELVSNITKVRGEFQQLEVAFSTILKSEERANELMSQLVRTAATTPFDLQSVAQGAKQLLAFGESADKVNEDLLRLGNIAAGLSIPLGDLIYLYGTTMTQGRLYTQDFNQFTSRGIPMIKELAKEFGVAENEVKGLVEAGRVGFPEVQKVIQNLTNEGGMFFQLMEKQSKTISGQISNIEDSFSMMFNEIGKANEGIINDALSSVSYLVEHYKEIGGTLMDIAVTYGVYKASLVAVTVAHKVHTAVLEQSIIEQKLAAAVGIQLSNAQAMAAARTKLLTTSVKSLNAALMANPYTLVATAVMALGYGMYKLATYQTDFQKGLKDLEGSVSQFNTKVIEEQRNLQLLKGQLDGATKGSEEYNKAKETIVKNYSKYYKGLSDEIEKVGLTEKAYNKLTEAINKSFGARQYKQFNEEQQGILDVKIASNLEKIQDRMIDKLGVEAGSKYYAKLRDAILQGNVKLGSGYNEILGLDNELKGVLDKVSGKDSKLFYWQDVEKWIKNIVNSQEAFDKLDIRARQRFGIEGDLLPDAAEVDNKAKQTFKTLADVQKAIADTEKKISDMRAKAQKGLIGTGDVDQVIAELDSLKKVYKSMTGVEYGKIDKGTEKKMQDFYNEVIRLQEDNEERQIEMMKDGTEKQLAEIELRYKREIAAINKLEEELRKAQGGKLTQDQTDIFTQAKSTTEAKRTADTDSVLAKQAEAERKAMNEYLAEYGDYWEKRKAIAEKYQSEISKATTEGERLSLQAGMTEALAKLDDEAKKKTSIITKLFGDMSKKSVASMREIANEAERMLSFIEGGQYDSNNSFGITEEQFKVLSQSPEKLEAIKNEIANVRNEADKASPTFEKIKDLLEKIFKHGGGRDSDLEEWLRDLDEQVGKVMQSVGFLSDSFSQLGDAFGSKALSGIGEGLNVAMGAMDSALKGAQAGAMFGPIGAGAGAALGAVTSLAGSIAKIHDKKNERRIQKLQEQIDTLEKSYEKLGKEIDRAYSKDASKLIEDNNKLLEQQKVLIQNQIAEEKKKKKTDKGRIKEWEEQIDNINELIEDNKEKAVDAIFGENIKSAIEDFASAMTNAWAQGTDASQSARDSVKRMMQQMVTEAVKAAIQTSGKMEEIRKKLQEFFADGILSSKEQEYIYDMADRLQQDIDNKFGWSKDLFDDKKNTQQTASSKGFETMTQDQASELNGRFTALYEVGLRQEQAMVLGNANIEAMRNIASETKDIIQSSYFELVEIRENTGAIVKPIIQMQRDMAEMKNQIKNKL